MPLQTDIRGLKSLTQRSTFRTKKGSSPHDTLCRILFSDGTETLDYLPTDVIRAPQISNIDWWMRKIGRNSATSHGIKRAVSVEPKLIR
ncbi:hypothetical protein [Aliamphritea spongicola]|uniref:hypothetical protein n=1 Tax=Aliamphritea spongicola TaxID=707589 RepID=UPI00196B449F|nr:hypothetical protein [Aliamphritea spongicola]MBN3563711.1 hypothetical protein [Aliamphritea spongicola]